MKKSGRRLTELVIHAGESPLSTEASRNDTDQDTRIKRKTIGVLAVAALVLINISTCFFVRTRSSDNSNEVHKPVSSNLVQEGVTEQKRLSNSTSVPNAGEMRCRFKNVKRVFWLHIQKTGTSFFNTFFYHFCPTALESIGTNGTSSLPMMDTLVMLKFPPKIWCNVTFVGMTVETVPHLPFTGFGSRTQNHHLECNNSHNVDDLVVLTMLRDPFERIKSAYYFGRHGSRNSTPELLSFQDFVRLPQIPNCQIKMTLGYGCFETVPESLLNVSAALERIRNPNFFFGFTDQWEESICLFHSWFGGKPRSFELKNNRPTLAKKEAKGTSDDDLIQPPPDLDTVFIRGAAEIFEERLEEANCKGFLYKHTSYSRE